MAKISHDPTLESFIVAAKGDGSPTTVRNSVSGKVLEIKGYGALAGQYVVRRGIDLSQPIAAQAGKADKRAGPLRKRV